MNQEQTFRLDVLFGTVEIEQLPYWETPYRLGYKSRRIERDIYGCITKIGEWQPPVCYLVMPEPDPEPPTLWQRFRALLKGRG